MESALPTPDDIRGLDRPAEKFLCRLKDNWADFKFRGFKIRDMVSGITLVEVAEDDVDGADLNDDDDVTKRLIKYHLGPDFLELKTVGLTMYFSIGAKPIKNMEMIEKHYFRNKCIREFSFKFGFIIPNSTNSWELVYDFPELSEEEKCEIRQSPWEVKSDSYYFADGKLMIHNRAEYNYTELD